jgi:hypothetical protein
MTALEGAQTMMRMQGYVVLGIIKPTADVIGTRFDEFADGYLDGHKLRVISETTREEWSKQRAALKASYLDSKYHSRTSKYFRAVLE